MQKEYSTVIYIIGPDHKKQYEQGLTFLEAKFNKVIVIGDGENDIFDNNGEGSLMNLKTLSQDHPDLLSDGKILIYVEAHGIAQDRVHYIQTAKDRAIPSKYLFELLAKAIPKPMDIIFTPCNGKAASVDIDVLPVDSRVIMFSDPDKSTIHQSLAITQDALTSNTFTLNNFYNNYLAHIFLMNESPAMFVSGGGSMDPITLSDNYLGKDIIETSRQYVHSHFGQSVCKNDTTCHNKIDYLMDKIEQSSSVDEVRMIASKNYFSAVNEYATQMTEYKFSRNSNHERDVIYNFQAPEYCYIEILALKNKTDQILLKHGIPLELDLSNKAWYGIDTDYPTDDELEFMKEVSDAGVFYIFKYEGYIENNNFPRPESAEYGYVLGIIKDIHLSFSPVHDSEKALPLNGENPLDLFPDLD